jgi:hypothetical protein
MGSGAALSLAAPWALALVLLFVPAVVLELRRGGPRHSVAMAGVDEFATSLGAAARRRKRYRALLLALLAVLLALVLSGPSLESPQPLLAADRLATQKNIVLAIDVSRSMSSPLEPPDREARLAAYGRVPGDAEPVRSRYAAARETVYRFIERFPDARVGLILFSTEPFLARWPTIETEGRFIEVLEENLDELTQLRRFSSLTNTDAALRLAGRVFAELETKRGGAVVHISDAEDELENMGLAIHELRAAGIRLYTFGVGISESVVEKLAGEFAGDGGFRIFNVDSEEEMEEAYRLVSELEESPTYTRSETSYVTDLRWLLALALAVLGTAALWLLEIGLPRGLLAYPLGRREA